MCVCVCFWDPYKQFEVWSVGYENISEEKFEKIFKNEDFGLEIFKRSNFEALFKPSNLKIEKNVNQIKG